MRAGLFAAAFVLAAVFPAVADAAPAQVPCTNIGGGHYECSWYRPGDGHSGGSLVVVGTTTVGYLPQGKNWISCQQAGGDVRNSAGNHNTWLLTGAASSAAVPNSAANEPLPIIDPPCD